MSETLFFKDKSIIEQNAVLVSSKSGKYEAISILTDGSEVLLGIDELVNALEWHGYEVTSPVGG